MVGLRVYGAVGDGFTNDTAAVQAAMNAGNREVWCEPGTYLIDTVKIPVTVRRVFGSCTLKQRTANENTLSATKPSGLTIEGLTLLGIPGSSIEGNNNAIFISGGSNVLLQSITCTGYQQNCFWIENSKDVTIDRSLGHGLAKGIQFRGVSRGAITNNVFRDTQLPNTVFTIPIYLDSTSGHTFGYCSDIRIANNLVVNYPNSQAIEIHAGRRIAVTGNVVDNVMMGISINGVLPADAISDIAVSGNTISGTSTSFVGASGGAGIQAVGADARHPAVNVAIVGNTVRNMNAAFLDPSTGAIQAHEADNVTIVGNAIHSTAGSGIVIGPVATRVLVAHNQVNTIRTASRENTGILVNGPGSHGVIVDNSIHGATDGVRFRENNYPVLIADRNVFTSVLHRYVNPAHAVTEGVGQYISGTTMPDVVNGAVRFIVVSNHRPTTISNFVNGVEGQVLRLQFSDSNTTITRANVVLTGGVDFASSTNAILTLVKQGDRWREVSRAVNGS